MYQLLFIKGKTDATAKALAAIGYLSSEAIWAISLAIFVFVVYCHWRICSKAGYSGALSLLTLVPLIGSIILMLILAFGKWPIKRQRGRK